MSKQSAEKVPIPAVAQPVHLYASPRRELHARSGCHRFTRPANIYLDAMSKDDTRLETRGSRQVSFGFKPSLRHSGAPEGAPVIGRESGLLRSIGWICFSKSEQI